jgi:small-conductance mechanosensitive channel
MTSAEWFEKNLSWFFQNDVQLIATLVAIALFFLIKRFFRPHIQSNVDASGLTSQTVDTASNLVLMVSSLLLAVFLLFIWGVDFQHMMLLGTSVITLLGVALFASWSLLSNVTAFVILLVHPSYRRGNYIRVINLDNYYEGYVADITLFHTKLITSDREVMLYPNNALLAAPVLINPRQRWQSVGKFKELENKPEVEKTE